MAETEKSEQPQTNGLENGLDEDERTKLRPADIDADVREMERRKRVEMIMSSKLFREELERIIELQLKDGNGPAGLLQQISDMMGIQSGKLQTTHMFRGSNCVTPINDIRGVESMGYEKGEKNLRCKLASVFRLMDLYGWSQGINNQITARLNQDEEHFLVNPHGMLFNEITASSLVKVDMQGNIVEPGTTNFSVNTQGFLLHSAIHASRPDVNCVIHIKTPSVLAVSSLKYGLLPVCQEALVIGEVSQHPFVSGIFEPEEREKIIRNLGPHNKVLLLHNHGALCCGATVEEAFYNVYNTVLACETQMKLMPIGVENLLLVNDETRKQVYDAAHRAPDGGAGGDKKKFRVGEMEFEALIRMLDNAGFRTGYIYRHPLVKGELPKPKNDVEVPPAVSSLGYLIEQEELYKQGNWKKYIDGRNRLDRTKWLNSPNVYQKVEILETGTSDPKKITKWVDQNSEEWVAESSPTHSSTPVKIDSALQFVPKGTNPKEFKKLQQQIKENRRADKITSGPQSHILEGVSWEEAKKLQDANITQTGDQVILVGAASKGIIQRNYQHNALVYKTPYAKNPFDSMSDKEIEDYKQLVERKQRGDTDYEESQSESEAISSSRQDALRHFKSPLLSPQSATSETEEESRDEPRVLRIETKTAPRPIQAEVVLSDAESDTTDARIERSHSARYPKAEKPESVTLMNSFRKSWSLKREKDKSKDVENICDSRNLHPSLFLNESERDRLESLHYCVARIKQLTHEPVLVDVGTKALPTLLKSASDPCNLSTLRGEDEVTEVDTLRPGAPKDATACRSCGNITTTDLQHRLHMRKKLLHSAKMKFLGYHNPDKDTQPKPKAPPTSPMCVLISEIRETINEIMSPERSKTGQDSDDDGCRSPKRSQNPTSGSRSYESDLRKKLPAIKSRASLSESFVGLTSPTEELQVLKLDFDDGGRSDTFNCSCATQRDHSEESSSPKGYRVDENQNEERASGTLFAEVAQVVGDACDEEATYTVTDDSLLQTYSFTESTETEWYYNKTITKLDNSQTMLEIKEVENKEENPGTPAVRCTDTGIDTDFTSEKENEEPEQEPPVEGQKETEQAETAEDLEADPPACESSGLNKSSETDSSFLKSGSGRTSNDVDTSTAFKTETENSDKPNEKSPEKGRPEEKRFLREMLTLPREAPEEESSDSGETHLTDPSNRKELTTGLPALTDIPESPEFTNIDTEDAPVTSSSKDTSPEVAVSGGRLTEDDPIDTSAKPEEDSEEQKENARPEHKRKKNVKSSTKITVKKELKEKHADEAVVSEIRLTIKNSSKCQSEKYEVKIQDVSNTSADLSRSVSSAGENGDSYDSLEIEDKSCDCEAQQNLEELQSEVSSTIEKLQGIENYFEDEIKKHSGKGRSGSDEFIIEYNYREFEEVLNESRDKTGGEKAFFDEELLSGELCGEIEILQLSDGGDETGDSCRDGRSENLEAETSLLSMESNVEDMAMSSAFVAAVLDAVLGEADEEDPAGKSDPEGGESGEAVEANHDHVEGGSEDVAKEELIVGADDDEKLTQNETDAEKQGCGPTEESIGADENAVGEPHSEPAETRQEENDSEKKTTEMPRQEENESEKKTAERPRQEENESEKKTAEGPRQEENESDKKAAERPQQEENESEKKTTEMPRQEENESEKKTERPRQEDNDSERPQQEENDSERPPQEVQIYDPTLPYHFLKALEADTQEPPSAQFDVIYILDCLLDSIVAEDKLVSSVSDVINFIVNNEESPTDSLAEFEDMENIICTTAVVVNVVDGAEVESLPEEEEPRDPYAERVPRGRRKGDQPLKVTIATSGKKEIFINYAPDHSSSFNASAGSEELCNSYIRTDEVNEDFDSISSDNPDFYSMAGSPGKNSLNSSFCSAEGNPTADHFCCEVAPKSPRSLGIIREVDEGDSSTSSEVTAAPHPQTVLQ